MLALRRLGTLALSTLAVGTLFVRPVVAASALRGRIAFPRTTHGNTDVYTMNGDGTDIARLTTAPAVDRQPSWSPDDQSVVFTSDRSGSFDLWEKALAGSLLRLTHGPAADRDPAFSPDGTEIAFVRAQSGHTDVWLFDVGTGTAAQLTHDGAHDAHPAWFPDGSAIAYDSDQTGQRELWVADASDGTSTPVDTGPGNNSDPSVRTGNDTLAFVSDRTGAPAIWSVQYPVGTPAQLTDGSPPDAAPTWSPYGDKITYAQGVGTAARLYQMGAVGQNQTQLTFGSGADGNPISTVRDKASDDQTKANVLQALDDANVIYARDGSYTSATPSNLADVDPSFVWQATASWGPSTMSVDVDGSGQIFGIAALSDTGLCFLIRDTGSTFGDPLILYGETWTQANCTGTYARTNASAAAWDY